MDGLPLARHAGPIAIVAGALLVLTDLARLVSGRAVADFASDPLTIAANAGYAVALVVLAVALVALYLRDAAALSTLGFVAALVGVVFFGGNMWFDGFAAPWLATVAPGIFALERTGALVVGALASYVLFGLGWVLWGAALLRARVHPWPFGAAFVVSGVLGLAAGAAPFGAPLGLTVAALGLWLSRPRSPATTPPAARAR
ncbi:hypothetical protein EV188_111185 [Actinomycetospora succinea]|uniref:AmiS/UreI family transporter n=1 Tax=Actinomycetospora succinea TaxID=663603 RepID=A0A4R6UZ89_9PSEU|nr:hypothetical protein [Actinomycetospora succinea]TDQ49014.1 hypothetical protein EV188_111185 [Actinomycetospora succinea]